MCVVMKRLLKTRTPVRVIMIALSLLALCAAMPVVVAQADKADLIPVGANPPVRYA